MKIIGISKIFLLAASWFLVCDNSFAAAPNAALVKAKQDAEAKGFLFESSHDDIVAKAKKEGKLRVISTMETAVIKAMRDSFKKKYPFIGRRESTLSPGAQSRHRQKLGREPGVH